GLTQYLHSFPTRRSSDLKMWGEEPAEVTLEVNSLFLENNFTNILIPGFGYGRNAKIFIENGFNVTGIEISETAIAISRDYIQGRSEEHTSELQSRENLVC